MTLSAEPVLKVTAFITRGADVLLIETAHAGVQFPAGTIEEGEAPEAAALREACEETALSEFGPPREVGVQDIAIGPPLAVTLRTTPIHLYPRADSASMATLRNGLSVSVSQTQDGFAQVTFREYADLARTTLSAEITGWTDVGAITRAMHRYFYVLPFTGAAPAEWRNHADHHDWRLFWAPVAALPEIVPAQAPWADVLRAALSESVPR